MRYDTSFRCQAAQTGHRRWSQLNPTLYSICFTGNAQKVARCELCLGFTHTAAECALRGEADPEMPGRVKVVESAILALAAGVPKSTLPRTSFGLPSGQLCRKYNKEGCTFPACRHTRMCFMLGETPGVGLSHRGHERAVAGRPIPVGRGHSSGAGNSEALLGTVPARRLTVPDFDPSFMRVTTRQLAIFILGRNC